MSSDPTAILARLDAAISELHAAAKAAVDLARMMAKETAARPGDDVEWTRMPAKSDRCRFSNFSRSKIDRLIAAKKVRRQRSSGGVFYSGADVRRLFRGEDPDPGDLSVSNR